MLPLQRLFLSFLLLLGCAAAAMAEEYEDLRTITPPRLSYFDGEISFWRPGAEDWLTARLNTPLAVGDELYAAQGANFELQIGARNFVRGDAMTQIALVNQEPDYLQFKVTTGRVSLDLRQLEPGTTVEVATPKAVFIISHEGYYRLDVNFDTHFITRRGGQATVIPAGGRAMGIHPSEEIVVRGGDAVRVETYVAPEPDPWDRWNFARTDDLLDAVSIRYLPSGVYGAHELDRYGSWRVVTDYGPVWIPDGIPHDWAPYSSGYWIWDPYYEWTWIDDAPWGWAPFHYGRWVFIDGIWAWAPGPVVVTRPAYAPALVAFFWAGDDVSVRIGIGTSGVFWVSLGWGEPVIPWWGRHDFRGKPWWGGWHGPRVVNNVVIKEKTVVNVTNIVYRNTRLDRAVAYLPQEHFGRLRERARLTERANVREMARVRGALPVRPGPESLAVGTRKGIRPPKELETRQVVVTRPPRKVQLPWRSEQPSVRETPPPLRVLPPPKREESRLRRPDYGTQAGDERPRPPEVPRFREMPQPERPSVLPRTPPAGDLRPGAPASPSARMEHVPQPVREPQQIRETGQIREMQQVRPPEPVRVPQRVRELQQTREAQQIGGPQPAPARQQTRETQQIRETQQVHPPAPVREPQQVRESQRVRESQQIRRDRPDQVPERREAGPREHSPDELRRLPGTPANRLYRRGEDEDGDRGKGR